MANTTKDDRTTLDVLIEKSVATLDLYEEHLAASRYQQANECLGLLERLTYQAHSIEDHLEYTGLLNTPVAAAKTPIEREVDLNY